MASNMRPAYGQFTGYEPLPDIPGAYNFQTADGKALTFGGPEADQLKARLDAANAQTMTAGDNAAGGFDAGAAVRDLTGAPPAPAAPPQQQAPGGQLGYGLRVSPQGTIQKYQAGSAGVTSDQLRARDAGAVAQRTGQQESVQIGPGANQEYLDTQEALTGVATDIENKRFKDEQAQLADAKQIADQQFAFQQRVQGEAAANEAHLQAKVAGEQALYDKAVEEHTSAKVEPQRLFASPARGFLAGLISGLGGYAAAKLKTPNYAQQIIDSAIDRDIHSQEVAIRLKGEKADNLLGNLQRSGMSLAQAKAAAGSIQANYYASQVAANQAKYAGTNAETQHNNLLLGITQSANEKREAYRVATQDKVARSTTAAFAQPRAATRGGFVDVADQLGTASKVQGLQKGEADIAKANRDATKAPPASPELRKVDQTLAALTSDQKRLSSYGDNDKPKTLANRSAPMRSIIQSTNDFLGEGSYESTYSDEEKNFIQDFESAKGNLVAAISVANQQGAMQEGERKEAEKKIAAAGTVGELKRAQAWVRDRLENQRAAAAATPGPAMEFTK